MNEEGMKVMPTNPPPETPSAFTGPPAPLSTNHLSTPRLILAGVLALIAIGGTWYVLNKNNSTNISKNPTPLPVFDQTPLANPSHPATTPQPLSQKKLPPSTLPVVKINKAASSTAPSP